MERSTNIKHKIDFLLLSNDALSRHPTQTIIKPKYKKKKCSGCNKIRTPSIENHQICYTCNQAKKRIIPSGNKVIDDFIKYVQTNSGKRNGKMIFVPYGKFENIELIGEGGFSKIYKATWVDCRISNSGTPIYPIQNKSVTVALKKLNNSNNITSKELNELKMFYLYSLNGNYKDIYAGYIGHVNVYYGITQDPTTQDLIFIMPYYKSDLARYITKDFYNNIWYNKLHKLGDIISGLVKIHIGNIIHRDLHSGNILLRGANHLYHDAKICDLGTSKSAIELTDNNDDNEIYGIIPYVAPEVLQGKKYSRASDIYSYGMIMWEVMVGRRPFWDRKHDTELIIEICDGLRPPIITNAPEGYIDLMKECWHPEPEKRPKADEVLKEIEEVRKAEIRLKHNETKIIKSSDIGPVTTNNPDAIYKSRYLSSMIKSAASTRSLRSQSITSELGKRKFEDNQFENNFINGESIKKIKVIEDKNYEYATKELELDIDINSNRFNDEEYITTEINFDI
ncbi:hypothetical protein RclHR1_03340015 [Rhizophagus clarus]|uniref:Kinase-like domain-containing protein n=1 Tax=Rhizophagus clarus TaxID=94130 RepID=A0A2Z6RL02_9GLOM|nr:hypothetical protein RclHR1_03340015 [Rhizophagus clarus]GES84835.1 kinase-like domain-containing protein [Rhizophagus clarus]